MDSLLREQFEALSEKLNYEMTMIGMRVHSLEKAGQAEKVRDAADFKVSREEFNLAIAELKTAGTHTINDKIRRELDNMEVSNSQSNFVSRSCKTLRLLLRILKRKARLIRRKSPSSVSRRVGRSGLTHRTVCLVASPRSRLSRTLG